MTPRYAFDPSRSRFTVQAFATGLLSALGHSPTFAVLDFSGFLAFDEADPRGAALELRAGAGSLRLLDRVRDSDHREIEDRMRREVLDTARFPEITFRSEAVTADPAGPRRYRLGLGGRLTVRGVERPIGLGADLEVFDGGLILRGGGPVRMSEFGIAPVTALAGAIRLKDELALAFDLAAPRETP
jgi:polyisoprenoid-binding protein YceI